MKNLLKTIFKLFKRKPKPLPPPERSAQEIKNDAHRHKYVLELIDQAYFIKYYFNGEWYWLRRFDEDYILEEKRGQAMRISHPAMIENIITGHQEWLAGGHIFLPFK